MSTLILRTTASLLLTLLLLFSFFLLFRGHNQTGGGFTGGLVAAAAWTLYAIAFGSRATREALRAEPRRLIAIGLLFGIVSGLVGLGLGTTFLTGAWVSIRIGSAEPFQMGTPLLFDFGVYLAVIGAALTIIFALEEE